MPKFFAVLAVVFVWLSPAAADELAMDRFHFTVSAQAKADNDWMVVVLSTQQQDKDLARAADAVNREMDWALEQLKGELRINTATEGYRSSPVYSEKGREVRAWRVNQQLRLESGNFSLLSKKLQKLQERLSIQHMRFSIKPDSRDLIVEDLMVDALANFNRRAKLVAHQMGATGFRTVDVKINSGGASTQRRGPEMMMRSMSADMAAPALAGGESEIVVNISAEIELQY